MSVTKDFELVKYIYNFEHLQLYFSTKLHRTSTECDLILSHPLSIKRFVIFSHKMEFYLQITSLHLIARVDALIIAFYVMPFIKISLPFIENKKRF